VVRATPHQHHNRTTTTPHQHHNRLKLVCCGCGAVVVLVWCGSHHNHTTLTLNGCGVGVVWLWCRCGVVVVWVWCELVWVKVVTCEPQYKLQGWHVPSSSMHLRHNSWIYTFLYTKSQWTVSLWMKHIVKKRLFHNYVAAIIAAIHDERVGRVRSASRWRNGLFIIEISSSRLGCQKLHVRHPLCIKEINYL